MTNNPDELMNSRPDVFFIARVHCPEGWDASLVSSKKEARRPIIYYNAELPTAEIYEAITHELDHLKDLEFEYIASDEYNREVQTAMSFIKEVDLRELLRNNETISDYEIASHFAISLDQLKRCIEAYKVKGIHFTNNTCTDPSVFYRTI